MEVVYVVLAVAVVAAIYFLFLRPTAPPEPEQLAPKEGSAKPQLGEGAQAPDRPAAAPAPATPPRESTGKTEAAPTPSQQKSTPEAPAPAGGAEPSALPAPAFSDDSISLRPIPEEKEPLRDRTAVELPSALPSVSHVKNVEGLRRGLEKARSKEGFFGRLLSLFAGKKEIDPNLTAQLEEVLLGSDVGTKTTELLLGRVRDRLSRGELADNNAVWAALREEALQILSLSGRAGAFSLRVKPTVVLMVGVNGVGKTTTIGKLATRLKAEGRHVILAAGDTFRAAAVQQLVVWGNRAGVEVVRGKDGVDPGSVIFDAVQRAKQVGADVVLADTAGRLHTKSNLMAELKKVVKTTAKALEGAPHEILLVVDATNGQNALAQAAEFQQAMSLTGVVLTKLDGTAKGGVVLGISDALQLPVRFVGLGETANDLHDFVPEEFVEALLGRDD